MKRKADALRTTATVQERRETQAVKAKERKARAKSHHARNRAALCGVSVTRPQAEATLPQAADSAARRKWDATTKKFVWV